MKCIGWKNGEILAQVVDNNRVLRITERCYDAQRKRLLERPLHSVNLSESESLACLAVVEVRGRQWPVCLVARHGPATPPPPKGNPQAISFDLLALGGREALVVCRTPSVAVKCTDAVLSSVTVCDGPLVVFHDDSGTVRTLRIDGARGGEWRSTAVNSVARAPAFISCHTCHAVAVADLHSDAFVPLDQPRECARDCVARGDRSGYGIPVEYRCVVSAARLVPRRQQELFRLPGTCGVGRTAGVAHQLRACVLFGTASGEIALTSLRRLRWSLCLASDAPVRDVACAAVACRLLVAAVDDRRHCSVTFAGADAVLTVIDDCRGVAAADLLARGSPQILVNREPPAGDDSGDDDVDRRASVLVTDGVSTVDLRLCTASDGDDQVDDVADDVDATAADVADAGDGVVGNAQSGSRDAGRSAVLASLVGQWQSAVGRSAELQQRVLLKQQQLTSSCRLLHCLSCVAPSNQKTAERRRPQREQYGVVRLLPEHCADLKDRASQAIDGEQTDEAHDARHDFVSSSSPPLRLTSLGSEPASCGHCRQRTLRFRVRNESSRPVRGVVFLALQCDQAPRVSAFLESATTVDMRPTAAHDARSLRTPSGASCVLPGCSCYVGVVLDDHVPRGVATVPGRDGAAVPSDESALSRLLLQCGCLDDSNQWRTALYSVTSLIGDS